MIELLTAPVFSGIIGAVGGYFNKRLELKAIDKQNEHELAMTQAKTQQATAIAQLDMQKAEVAGKLAVSKSEMLAFRDSQKNNSQWADVIKSIIRPLILLATGYLCWENITAIQTMVDTASALDSQQLAQLYTTVVTSVFSIFTMGAGWYFGQRTSKITDRFMSIGR